MAQLFGDHPSLILEVVRPLILAAVLRRRAEVAQGASEDDLVAALGGQFHRSLEAGGGQETVSQIAHDPNHPFRAVWAPCWRMVADLSEPGYGVALLAAFVIAVGHSHRRRLKA